MQGCSAGFRDKKQRSENGFNMGQLEKHFFLTIFETSHHHVSDDIRFVFFRLHWVPAQGHVVALLNPHEVVWGLSGS